MGGYIAVSDVFGGAIPVLGLILSGLTPTGLASYIPPNVPPSFEQEVEILAQALLSELSSYAPSLVWLAPYRIVGGGTLPSNKGAGGGDLVPVFPADQVSRVQGLIDGLGGPFCTNSVAVLRCIVRRVRSGDLISSFRIR